MVRKPNARRRGHTTHTSRRIRRHEPTAADAAQSARTPAPPALLASTGPDHISVHGRRGLGAGPGPDSGPVPPRLASMVAPPPHEEPEMRQGRAAGHLSALVATKYLPFRLSHSLSRQGAFSLRNTP